MLNFTISALSALKIASRKQSGINEALRRGSNFFRLDRIQKFGSILIIAFSANAGIIPVNDWSGVRSVFRLLSGRPAKKKYRSIRHGFNKN